MRCISHNWKQNLMVWDEEKTEVLY